MPASASIVVTAMPTPMRPAIVKVKMMPAMMIRAGTAVASSETARPWITLVPWPETEAWAIERTGR